MGASTMKCPVCGAAHAVCGPSSSSTPISLSDLPVRKDRDIVALQEYRYVDGNGYETTAMLSEADAARVNAVPVNAPAVVELPADPPETKSRPVGNKARTAEDK